MADEKNLSINVKIIKGNISTGIRTKNLSPQEVIGLLEMIKDQFMEKLRKNKKDIINATKEEDE